MATPVPIRDLGQYGIIKDTAPFDLPVNAWSDGANVLFQGNRVTSAPIFRNITDIASVDGLAHPPIYTATIETAAGFDPILLATNDFRFKILINDALQDVSPVSPAAGTSTERYTSVSLSNVFYLNRYDNVPLYYDTLTGLFAPVPNWDSTWRTKAFRAYKDFAVAIGVTKSATDYPTMVKWSDAVTSGSVPGTWDPTVLSSLAGENILTEASTPLIDGGPLKNDFIIYSQGEVFVMEFIGAPLVFSFRRLFNDDGIMSPNCHVEVQGKHYVFGTRDIYVHDGMSKKSLVEGKNKKHIFKSLDASKADQCFVFHSPKINCIYFCYPTPIDEVGFVRTPNCNRAAIYNYVNNTMTFADLPNATSATFANIDTKMTYAAAGTAGYTYAGIGGTYSDQEDSRTRHVIMTSLKHTASGISASRVLALDDTSETAIAKPSVPELAKDCYVVRVGLGLTTLGYTLDSRKLLSTMYPLVQSEGGVSGFTVSFGRHDNPDVFPTADDGIPFDPQTQYKVDTRNMGRFLTMRYDFPNEGGVYLSGYDVDIRRVQHR